MTGSTGAGRGGGANPSQSPASNYGQTMPTWVWFIGSRKLSHFPGSSAALSPEEASKYWDVMWGGAVKKLKFSTMGRREISRSCVAEKIGILESELDAWLVANDIGV